MAEWEIQKAAGQPPHEVHPDATFEQVLQYTEHFVGGGYQRSRGWNEYYRYDRYRDVLCSIDFSELNVPHRIAHIDIGCGSGLFGWALLDWVKKNGGEYKDVDLYGYDHSSEMIRLVWMLRHRLARVERGYPVPSYYYDQARMLQKLAANNREGTYYIITFGYVLAGTYSDENAIRSFSQVIGEIMEQQGNASRFFLLASEAKSRGNFTAGWRNLKASLQSRQIALTCILRKQGDRCVILSRKEV
jgi:hypothetical protein